MMRLLSIFALLVALQGGARAGELRLHADQVDNGELAILRWVGEPPSFGVAH